jgi:hypothetical protein
VAAEGEIIKPPEETPFNLRVVGERVHLSSGKLTNVSSRDNMADNMSNSVVEESVSEMGLIPFSMEPGGDCLGRGVTAALFNRGGK